MGSHVTGRTLHIRRGAAGGIPGFWGGEWPGRAGRAGRERRVERPLGRGPPSRASPAGTLAVGTCRARGAGPLGGSMKVTSLDGRQLRKMLRKEAAARCVVLDCRPYLAFAASSVRGSLNVNLNSVVLRRARGGAVSARYVLPDEAARARLLQEGGGGVAAVVVLDQGSRHWQKLREESAARVVLTSLLACLPAGPRVYFLKGERVGAASPLSPSPLRDGPGLWGPILAQDALLGPGTRKVATCLSLHIGARRALGRALPSVGAQLCSPHPRSSKAPDSLSFWVGEVGYAAGGLLLSSLGAVDSCWAPAPVPSAGLSWSHRGLGSESSR